MQRYLALQKILELGSFTKAADALGYSQSSVSQMIASLEDEYSLKLLNRSRVKVSLSPEGEELYPFIERMILQYRLVQEKSDEIKSLVSGTVRVGTLSSISVHWFPKLMKEFQCLYPNVDFVIHQGDYSSIQEWIRTEEVDFGFVSPDAVTKIQTHIIKQGKMLAVLPAFSPLAELDAVPLSRLCEEPFILLEEGHYSEPMEAFRKENLSPDISCTIHDDYTIMTMVEAGLGVSILAELILYRTHYNLALRETIPPIYRTIAIGYKDKNYLPLASKRFIEYLIAHVDELP